MRASTDSSMLRAAGFVAMALLCLGLSTPAAADPQRNIRFDRLSLEHGLSQSAINCIFQDSRGFMWFGTEDGLNRYDGYEFTIYKHDPADPQSLNRNFIWSIHEDEDRTLWIGTDGGGLERFDPDEETFTHFRHDPGDDTSVSNDRVRVVFEDSSGRLWIGTDGGGLNRLDRETGRFARYPLGSGDRSDSIHAQIRAMHEDPRGFLWIGTYGGGLSRFDPERDHFTHFRHDPDNPTSLSDDRIYTLFGDQSGRLWVGTYRGGLNLLDSGSGQFLRYRNDPGDPDSLAADLVRAVFNSQDGGLWIGTDNGLNEWRSGGKGFAHYANDPADPMSISDNMVTAIYADRGGVLWVGTKSGGLNRWNVSTGFFDLISEEPSGNFSLSSSMVTSVRSAPGGVLWVGTFGGGLNRVDREARRVRAYRHDSADPSGLNDDRVMALHLDRTGAVWIGAYEGGLNRLDPASGRFDHYLHDPEDPASLSSNGVMAIFEDRGAQLWVGTYGGGLNRFDRETGGFTRYTHDPADPSSLSSDRVTCFAEHGSTLWVGTDGGGLNRIDRSTGELTRVGGDPDLPGALGSDVIWSLHVDDLGNLWVGTQGGGLSRWDAADQRAGQVSFEHYTEKDGLPNDFVYGILSDATGRLWLSTNRGLSRFDPTTGIFRNYDVSRGLQSPEFNFGAYHESADGEMFFGGINGLNAFYPEQIRDNPHVPPVVLTRFFKFNQEVDIDRTSEGIVLDHDDYVLSFEFAALDYTAPERNRYAYKLEGFDEEWNELGTLRRATYTNLDGGDYVLRVRASNSDGLWNEEGLAVGLRMLPPPWATWWAYTLYGLVLAGVVVAYTGVQRRKLQREAEYSRRLEKEVSTRTTELADRNRELELANRMLEEASLTDSLTGLRNRRYLMTEIDRDVALVERYYSDPTHRAQQSSAPSRYLFLMIDLDGLKQINDEYGHMAGDMTLLQMRDLLHKVCRKTDTIIRWGGDEFLVVGRNVDDGTAERLAERIRDAVEAHPFTLGIGEAVRLSCSVGFAHYPFLPAHPTLISWEQVITIADRALYMAKHSGRNAWVALFGNDKTPDDDLVSLVNDQVKDLLEQGQLELRTSIQDEARVVLERT